MGRGEGRRLDFSGAVDDDVGVVPENAHHRRGERCPGRRRHLRGRCSRDGLEAAAAAAAAAHRRCEVAGRGGKRRDFSQHTCTRMLVMPPAIFCIPTSSGWSPPQPGSRPAQTPSTSRCSASAAACESRRTSTCGGRGRLSAANQSCRAVQVCIRVGGWTWRTAQFLWLFKKTRLTDTEIFALFLESSGQAGGPAPTCGSFGGALI